MELIFELGRYTAFLGVFFFVLFGIGLFLFRSALDRQNLSISDETEVPGGGTERKAVDMTETVHYLRRRDYDTVDTPLRSIGQRYRNLIVWPFYLGVWSFCIGLGLMSLTFGFVLFD
ncbi:MAG: hypothetical protein ABJG15_06815 [Hyphomonadaceae bacterium]